MFFTLFSAFSSDFDGMMFTLSSPFSREFAGVFVHVVFCIFFGV